MKKHRLADIRVDAISLVRKGANGKTVILKSADAKTPDVDRFVAVKKFDEAEGIVYGIVYAPGQVDAQGDFADAADIKKAAYQFMKDLKNLQVDRDHDDKPAGAYVAESWLVRKGDELFDTEPEGAWAVGIQIENDELKKAVKDGEITGLSMAGTATRTAVSKADEQTTGAIAAMTEFFKRMAKGVPDGDKDKDGDPDKDKDKDPNPDIAALTKALGEIPAALQGLNDRIGQVEKKLSLSKQRDDGGWKPGGGTEEQLGAEIAKAING